VNDNNHNDNNHDDNNDNNENHEIASIGPGILVVTRAR
jgi:hypothetical protein